jgi:hypothetical protein
LWEQALLAQVSQVLPGRELWLQWQGSRHLPELVLECLRQTLRVWRKLPQEWASPQQAGELSAQVAWIWTRESE